jgi:hypothetical protein
VGQLGLAALPDPTEAHPDLIFPHLAGNRYHALFISHKNFRNDLKRL